MDTAEKNVLSKKNFTQPQIEVTEFLYEDIITVSGTVDGNQGEWDPQ